MALSLIERNFAEQLLVTQEIVDGVTPINSEEEVSWLYSFLTADRKKSYCLYEAPTADHIRAAARRTGIPADVVVAVDEMRAEAFS